MTPSPSRTVRSAGQKLGVGGSIEPSRLRRAVEAASSCVEAPICVELYATERRHTHR